MDPREFLTALWGDPPPGKALIWMAPQKRSSLYIRFDQISSNLAKFPERDIYTGVGLAHADAKIRADRRAGAEEVAGIPGLWADIDVQHPAHRKQNLPPTMEEAQGILDQLEQAPTILINSGHGLQAWWLFDEPWLFQSDKERRQAHTLAVWWHERIAKLCATHGWALDPTHDLSRLMRVPGTRNNKAEPVPVTTVHSDGPRYNHKQLLKLVPRGFRKAAAAATSKNGSAPRNGPLTLSADAEPSATKLAAMLLNDLKFKRSWEGSRKDLPDQSASAYDMSLASIAVTAEWTDQEVVNLLIAWRRAHGHDLKLRQDYYRRTIERAREPVQQAQAQERLEEVLAGNSKQRSELLRQNLTTLLGVDIIRMVKYLGDPPWYWMETPKGSITIGQIHKLRNQTTFCDAIAATTGIVVRTAKESVWRKRLQALLDSCEEVEVGQASSPAAETQAWLEEYLTEKTIGDNLEHATTVKGPFLKDGNVYIFNDAFRKWVDLNAGINLDSHTMGRRLRLCGALPEMMNMTVNEHRTTRNCWRLPTPPPDQ